MIKALGLRTFIVRVPDLAAAKSWYAKAFGTEPYFDQPFYVGFDIAGYELGLQPVESEEQQRSGANIETYWGVEDVQSSFDQLLAHGATTHEAPQNVGGSIIVATVKDPWGNVLGLIYNPDFKTKPA